MRDGSTATGLHPALTYHVANTLGWTSLHPLQRLALEPIVRGDHALLVAPTAGGKTEAALFPVLSRMLEEDWRGLSVLYLCPLRALLNNLLPRVERYATLIGRRASLWHGDVGESAREAVRDDPPDVLLTTPESVEAMCISRRTDHGHLFRDLRVVVVDEIHAFAGDDRGWHLLAVAQRLERIAWRRLQRIGLSATVGNAEELLEWLTRASGGAGVVLQPPPAEAPVPEVTLDHVGSLANAATVISRLHRGEKRLVFVDSRARVEELGAALRDRGVATFVSHGSLGREERRAAERAFGEARDCVIVATSTLELGIDVGDLDRVIQVDAPMTVASFLQRMGRTGRRAATTANTLFLTTSDQAFLQAAGLLRAWEDGFVEPLVPPPLPLHLAVQQLLALTLQEGGVGRHTWTDWLGSPFVLGDEVAAWLPGLVDHLLERRFLFEDQGILGIGEEGQRRFGGRNFLELMAVFSDPPTLKVLAGRNEIGQVPVRLLTLEQPGGHIILLAGRDWAVRHIDWRRGVVQVEPAPERGRVRWFGQGRALSWELCQAMKQVLGGRDPGGVQLSRRATARLAELRDKHAWVSDTDDTVIVQDATGRRTWWTFAGADANLWLAAGLRDIADQTMPGDLNIRLRSDAVEDQLRSWLSTLDVGKLRLTDQIAAGAVDRLKFGEALSDRDARAVIERRLADHEAVETVARSPLRVFHASEAN